MIDPNVETLVSLSEVPRHLPRRRGGKKPHISCIYRWTKGGCKGQVLESLQVGGTRCTSLEALARFFEALTYGPARDRRVRSPAQRRRAIEAATRELQMEGA